MLLELAKYFIGFISDTHGTCDVTLVRRYNTPCGFVGEMYVDDGDGVPKYFGVTCDNFVDRQELIRHTLRIGFEQGRRVLRTDTYVITNGDFTAKVAYNTALVGSMQPTENREMLSRLIDKVKDKQYIRMTVLNRLLAEF